MQSNRLYVLVLVLITLLTAVAGIVSEVAAEQLPAWLEPLRPWVWPVLIVSILVTVGLVLLQARLESARETTSPSSSSPIHVHVEVPASQAFLPPSAGDLPIHSKPTIYHNLPQPNYGAFIGRKEELEQVRRILRPYPHSQEHLVTIDGVGGIGKSALALEAAYRYMREYDRLPEEERFRAIIWASARAAVLTANGIVSRPQITRTLEDIHVTIAITLEHEDITRAHPDERAALVTKALKGQRTLLIVDNLETVDDERVNAFLRELPAPTKAIVTTRHRIDVAYPVRLVGMSWEEAQALVSLECDKKGASLNQEQIRRLYDRTGGVPLALVWSVALMAYGYSADEVLRRLGCPQGNIARFCFEATLERIRGKSAFRILLALAVFATDASREALGDVAGLGEDILSRDEGLAELEKLSLANRRDGRFSLLPLTKAYALSLCPDEQASRLRQEEFYLRHCRKHGGSSENWTSYSQMDPERENLVDLMEWCLQNQRWRTLIDLQAQLRDYWELRGYWSEQEKWCEHALMASTQLPAHSRLSADNQRKRGRCHLALCWIRLNQDRFDDARAEAHKAIGILQPAEDWDGMAIAYRHLGLTEKLNGESDQAKNDLERAKERFELAKQHYDTALEIWHGLENRREISSILANIGHLLIPQGRYSEARSFLEQALVIRREIKDASRISTTLRGLGLIDESEGRLRRASEYYLEALEIARQVGDGQSVGESLLGLAGIALNRRECHKALMLATEACEHFESLNKTGFLRKDMNRAMEITTRAQSLL